MFPVVYVILVLSFTPHKPDAHWVPMPASGVYLTIKECRENLGPPPGYPGNIVHGEYMDDSRSSQRCVAYVPGKVAAIAQTPPPPPPIWVLMETGNTDPPWDLPEQGRM
jgi:hypothetical protein